MILQISASGVARITGVSHYTKVFLITFHNMPVRKGVSLLLLWEGGTGFPMVRLLVRWGLSNDRTTSAC
jgi:hypothetical protein